MSTREERKQDLDKVSDSIQPRRHSYTSGWSRSSIFESHDTKCDADFAALRGERQGLNMGVCRRHTDGTGRKALQPQAHSWSAWEAST